MSTSLYIHIPFCKRRCYYCAFYSTTDLRRRDRYTDALCHEMALRPTGDTVDTVYIGGGTPSQLTTAQTSRLLEAVKRSYRLAADAEVTIEVNPDDVTAAFAASLSAMPIAVNRVSMGAQTMDDERLRQIGRRHDARQVVQAVDRLRSAGIGNISVDLMYGFEGETLADWEHDIDAVLALGPDHLSAYCLTLEEGTPLYERSKRQNAIATEPAEAASAPYTTEEQQRAMYYLLTDRLSAAGFEHYEISNFAHPGRRSRHNSGYWSGKPYIGIGAAAHSYDGHRRRQWNVSDIERYMAGVEAGTPDTDGEWLTAADSYNDHVMLSLRTSEGLLLESLTAAERAYVLRQAGRYVGDGLMAVSDGRLRLSREGLFVSDMIMSDLMQV
jgi:oxygen-independent coproporphyrinogen-3 oxidase